MIKFCPYILGLAHAMDKEISPKALECMEHTCGLWDANWTRCSELTKALKLYDLHETFKTIDESLKQIVRILGSKR